MQIRKIAKEQLTDRLNPKTTGNKWKKIRNVAGLVAAAGGLVLIMPVSLPVGVVGWVQWGVALSTLIAGGSHLDKSKKD